MSPALAGRVSTTAPPGKPKPVFLTRYEMMRVIEGAANGSGEEGMDLKDNKRFTSIRHDIFL